MYPGIQGELRALWKVPKTILFAPLKATCFLALTAFLFSQNLSAGEEKSQYPYIETIGAMQEGLNNPDLVIVQFGEGLVGTNDLVKDVLYDRLTSRNYKVKFYMGAPDGEIYVILGGPIVGSEDSPGNVQMAIDLAWFKAFGELPYTPDYDLSLLED